MGKLSKPQAQDILRRCHVSRGVDFHALPSKTVERLLAEADTLGYRKPKNANGSRARYFHAYVNRVASRRDD